MTIMATKNPPDPSIGPPRWGPPLRDPHWVNPSRKTPLGDPLKGDHLQETPSTGPPPGHPFQGQLMATPSGVPPLGYPLWLTVSWGPLSGPCWGPVLGPPLGGPLQVTTSGGHAPCDPVCGNRTWRPPLGDSLWRTHPIDGTPSFRIPRWVLLWGINSVDPLGNPSVGPSLWDPLWVTLVETTSV
jgi:hypothetical protein